MTHCSISILALLLSSFFLEQTIIYCCRRFFEALFLKKMITLTHYRNACYITINSFIRLVQGCISKTHLSNWNISKFIFVFNVSKYVLFCFTEDIFTVRISLLWFRFLHATFIDSNPHVCLIALSVNLLYP